MSEREHWLPAEQIEVLAELVADRLAERLAAQRRPVLVDVQAVATYLDVEPDFVYRHAVELGARRLGDGPRSRLRFSLDEVDERLRTCSSSRGSAVVAEPVVEPFQRRRRSQRSGTGVPLLPVRGQIHG